MNKTSKLENKKNSNKPSYASAVLKDNNKMAIADSGTSGHFLGINSACVNKMKTNEGINVQLPDGSCITSTHTASLNLPQLPPEARKAHIFPELTHALISISMLCKQGLMAIFDDEKVYITKDGGVILHGEINIHTGLYMIDIEGKMTPHPKLNVNHLHNIGAVKRFAYNAYEIKAKKELVEYYHRCCFSPVISTWITAIKMVIFVHGQG